MNMAAKMTEAAQELQDLNTYNEVMREIKECALLMDEENGVKEKLQGVIAMECEIKKTMNEYTSKWASGKTISKEEVVSAQVSSV